ESHASGINVINYESDSKLLDWARSHAPFVLVSIMIDVSAPSLLMEPVVSRALNAGGLLTAKVEYCLPSEDGRRALV
ncbi:MAG: hypothetical protein ABIO62_03325, partial [Paracoccaceae bacterium]